MGACNFIYNGISILKKMEIQGLVFGMFCRQPYQFSPSTCKIIRLIDCKELRVMQNRDQAKGTDTVSHMQHVDIKILSLVKFKRFRFADLKPRS